MTTSWDPPITSTLMINLHTLISSGHPARDELLVKIDAALPMSDVLELHDVVTVQMPNQPDLTGRIEEITTKWIRLRIREWREG